MIEENEGSTSVTSTEAQPAKNPCNCRKPWPGMMFEAADTLKIDLAKGFMIGDRWRDADCGSKAGCKNIFVDWGYQETLKRQPDYV